MKPLAIDLCCGLGGWTEGLQAVGWRVIGIDIADFSRDYPGDEFIRQDVRTVDGTCFRGKVGLVVGSPPCNEFSYRSFPFNRARNAPPPTLGIELFRACERIGQESGTPYVLENVRGARRWVGQPITHLGPFYLWGTGVPALWPEHLRHVVKGFTRGVAVETANRQTSGRRMGKSDPQDLWRNREGSCDGRKYEFAEARAGPSKKKRMLLRAGPDGKVWLGNMSPTYRENALGWASGARQYAAGSSKRAAWAALIAKIPFDLAKTVAEAHYPIRVERGVKG